MWGGMNDYFFAPDTDQALISAYSNYLINAPLDPYAAVILNAAYVQSIDTFIWAGDYHYSKPVVNPPIFENFTAVTPFASTNRLDNLTDFTIEFNNTNPGGFRYVLICSYFALSRYFSSFPGNILIMVQTNVLDTHN